MEIFYQKKAANKSSITERCIELAKHATFRKLQFAKMQSLKIVYILRYV